MKTSTKDVLAQDIIDGLRKRIAELEAALKAKTAEFDRLLRRDTDNLKRLNKIGRAHV